ncbi:MAG: hypothetical protein AAF849_03200 [Bacteroidota bacterium]
MIRYYFVAFLLSAFLACSDDELGLNCREESTLFVNTCPLEIPTQEGFSNTPIFEVDELTSSLLFIGIFDATPIVEDEALFNKEALVWQWKSASSSVAKVRFEDGEIIKSSFAIENVNCLNTDTLYWAAWSWEESGRRVLRSTSVHTFEFIPERTAKLQVQKIDFVNDEDGLVLPGEGVNLKIAIHNAGTSDADNVNIQLSHPDIPELPRTVSLEVIPANQTSDAIFDFEIPNSYTIGDTIQLKIDIQHSACVQEATYHHILEVTALPVALQRVKLVRITRSPPGDWTEWDPFNVAPWSSPDPYFIITVEGSQDTLYRSAALENVDKVAPNASWPILDPFVSLEFDKLYGISVIDDDPDIIPGISSGDNDPIGDVIIDPKEFLKERSRTVLIVTNAMILQLELLWQ